MKICQIDDCERLAKARGYCPTHYGKYWRRNSTVNGQRCIIVSCENPPEARGYCSKHNMRLKNRGTLDDPPAKSGKWIDPKGYVVLYVPGGYNIFEHRRIMEDFLGRKLLPGENVHHRNGHKADNRIENLELWVTIQPSGQRVEDLVEYANEILRRYG